MPRPLEALLAVQPLVILDGALATELERHGADLADPLWSARVLLEDPALIGRVHRDYFEAGADVATTATYQATFEGFAHRGLGAPAAAALMRSAVSLAVAARDAFWGAAGRSGRQRPLIAASVGPYGAMLADGSEYRGRYSISDGALRAFHRPRFTVLAESGADLLAFETIPCLREALVLADLLRDFPGLTAWLSFSCRNSHENNAGEDIGACGAAVRDLSQIAAVGINCTHPDFAVPLLQRLSDQVAKPLLAYPNSGDRYDATARRWRTAAEPRPFAAQARAWYEAGARLIGGCCRTTPEDIRELRRILRAPAAGPGQ